MTTHPIDDLAAHALGILDPAEQHVVTAHLDACAACRAEHSRLAETIWTVAESQSRQGPSRLRAAIVERARRDPANAAGVPRSRWSGLFRPIPFVVPLGLAAVLVLALVGYGSARRDADRYADALTSVAGARVVPLAAADTTAALRGSLVQPVNGAKAYLILDLPAAPAGKIWEAWVIHGSTPVRAGVTGERGVTVLILDVPIGAGDTVALTPEPVGGVDAPTGPVVLSGRS